ncbi:MAG: gephyrin-like molybdotransferase Glp [Isosphaeraceae bacterium]
MLTIAEALALVIEQAKPLPAEDRALREVRGCRLAEEVAADLDQPPFTRSLVDGFAVRSTDLKGKTRRLKLVEMIMAGRMPDRALQPGETAAIMTGAPLPPGADAVVMLEDTRIVADQVEIDARNVEAGQNLQEKGRIYRAGDPILRPGTLLSPACLALLASVGRLLARVVPRPRVAIIPTGDELVEPDQVPGPGQIRNSNAVMLEALVSEHGPAWVSAIAPDEPRVLKEMLGKGLDFDALVVTGGVSVGERDLVPATLLDLGVKQIFHKVRLKPGKPLWFGIGPGRGDRPGALVFGLPGNPASGLVGFLLFIRPALCLLAGHPLPAADTVQARLGNRFVQKGKRPTYYPARRVDRSPATGDEPVVETLDWAGSADLLGIARADGLAIFPEGDRVFPPGEIVPFLPLR